MLGHRTGRLDGAVSPALRDLRRGCLAEAAELWRRLSAVMGQPSAIRKIIVPDLAVHPEIRLRALELQDKIAGIVSCYLARASRHPGNPAPEHDAAARLLTIAAGMAPLVGAPSLTLIQPDPLATLISEGLRARGA